MLRKVSLSRPRRARCVARELLISLNKFRIPMPKSPNIEHIVTDEVNERTYVVMGHRMLTEGEIYLAIRLELRRRGSLPPRGERLVITSSK